MTTTLDTPTTDAPTTPTPSQLATLDGQTITAVYTSDSHLRADAHTFVWTRALEPDEAEALRRAWESLDLSRRGKLEPDAVALIASLGLTLPPSPAPAPLWDASFTGTRKDWMIATDFAETQRVSFVRERGLVLDAARSLVFTSAGAIELERETWLEGCASLSYDSDVRFYNWDDSGVLTLTVHDGQVYSHPIEGEPLVDIFARADESATVATAQAVEANRVGVAQANDADLAKLIPTAELLGLTWEGWHARLELERAKLQALLVTALGASPDASSAWEEFCTQAHPARVWARTPQGAHAAARAKVLTDAGVTYVQPSLVTTLVAAFAQ